MLGVMFASSPQEANNAGNAGVGGGDQSFSFLSTGIKKEMRRKRSCLVGFHNVAWYQGISPKVLYHLNPRFSLFRPALVDSRQSLIKNDTKAWRSSAGAAENYRETTVSITKPCLQLTILSSPTDNSS